MKRRFAVIVAPFLALTLIVAACGDDGAGAAAASIRLGSLPPLTGDLSDFGPSMAEAVKLAGEVFSEAAKKAGLGITVTVSSQDSQTTAAAATEGARKLVD